MLNVYDLYDLHEIFVLIRSFPKDELNAEIINGVCNVLINGQDNCEPNQFRVELQSIPALRDREHYKFVFTNNVYSYYPLSFLKEQRIYAVLIKACQKLQEAINEGNEERIYDLADCLHDLPIILAENKYPVPKFYWKTYVKYYRNKWDNGFLQDEEKVLKKRHRKF